MLLSHVSFLRCPRSGEALQLVDPVEGPSGIDRGLLVGERAGTSYPIVRGIPRFVSEANYAASFAEVVAIDYSSAVDACLENHRTREKLSVIQADVYNLPFAPGAFDFVYCLGVLQHTPDVHAAFLALPEQLAPGGRLAVDLYPRLALNVLWPKYWLRPITRRLPKPVLLATVEAAVPVLLPVSRLLGRVPKVGRKLRRVVPVADYEGVLPLSKSQLTEWAILDTFDMLAPAHDHPQSAETLRAWFAEAQLTDVHVARDGFLVGRGRRASAA